MGHNDCQGVVIIPFMVDIICPHCDEELELDEGGSGDFECPLCDGEFEWDGPEINNSNHDLFKLKQYSIKRNLTISMSHFDIFDSRNEVIAFAWMRPLVWKEEMKITSDPEYQNSLIAIDQTNLVDAWGEFVFTDPEDGSRIGSTKRRLWKSTIQASWNVFDANGKNIGEMRDDWAGMEGLKKMKANSKKLFSGFKLPSYSIYVEGEEPIVFSWGSPTRVLHVNIPSYSTVDHRIIAAMAMIMSTIEVPDADWN